MEFIYNNERVNEIMREGDSSSLDDILDIEDLLAKISEINNKIDIYKKQKKKRSYILDTEIKNLISQENFLREIIKNTLLKSNEKSISFPTVGQVRLKEADKKLVINNEEELIQLLKDTFNEDKIEGLIRIKESINKKQFDLMIKEFETSGDWPSEEFKDAAKSMFYIEETPENIVAYFNKDTKVESSDFSLETLKIEDKEDKNKNNESEDIFGEILMEDI